ncbi:MAG: hypothetical protein O3A25_09095 [Acidobacteria bacterium]|nr:hypothetical protein [Acidobacteriota bacterium]
MSTRKRVLRVMTLSAAVWAGGVTLASAQAQSVSLNLGYFSLQGQDTRDFDVLLANKELFAFDLEQFNNASIGAEWQIGIGDFVEAGLGASFYQRTVFSVYNDFVNDDGTEIPQDFKLRVSPVTATARFYPFGLRSPVQPFAGVGVGFFNWRYSEVGEFIDFDTFEVFQDRFVATGNDVGPVYVGGIRVMPSDHFGVGLELRYQDVDGRVGIDQGFLEERIDLGGLTTSFTANFRF